MRSILFPETNDSYNGFQADEGTLFAAERGMQHLDGDPPARLERRFHEAVEFVSDLMQGARLTTMVRKYGIASLNEALTTADFPLIFGNIMYRRLLGQYNAVPQNWRQIADIDNTVTDFRQRAALTIDGAATAYAPVKEQSEYPEIKLVEGQYLYNVSKFGERLALSWEMTVNDDLRAFQRAPGFMALGGARSIQKFVTGLYVSSTGPNATFYSDTNKNVVDIANGAATDNPPLSIDALIDALTVLSKQVDKDGEPIVVQMVHLRVPPALKGRAYNVLNATQVFVGGFGQVGAGGTAATQLQVNNWVQNLVEIEVDPYLATINTTNGNTAWYLFADPNQGRPAIEVGFLRGMEEPQMLMKAGQQMLMGGAPQAEYGSFENDTIEYKARLVYGGTLVDPKMSVVSKGTGAP